MKILRLCFVVVSSSSSNGLQEVDTKRVYFSVEEYIILRSPLVYPVEPSFPLRFVDFAKPKVADPDANGTGFKLKTWCCQPYDELVR